MISFPFEETVPELRDAFTINNRNLLISQLSLSLPLWLTDLFFPSRRGISSRSFSFVRARGVTFPLMGRIWARSRRSYFITFLADRRAPKIFDSVSILVLRIRRLLIPFRQLRSQPNWLALNPLQRPLWCRSALSESEWPHHWSNQQD